MVMHATPCEVVRQQALIRKLLFVVAGHCYSATAIRGQLARDMFQDFVENLEGEILTLS